MPPAGDKMFSVWDPILWQIILLVKTEVRWDIRHKILRYMVSRDVFFCWVVWCMKSHFLVYPNLGYVRFRFSWVILSKWFQKLIPKKNFWRKFTCNISSNVVPISIAICYKIFKNMWPERSMLHCDVFCHTLTYENCHNSLNFWNTGLKFWI